MPQIVGGGVLIFIGLLWLMERTGVIDISVTAVLALGTIVIGVSLMLLAGDGPHVGLIVFGTLLALVTLLTAAAPFEGFQGGVGDRVIVIDSVDDIRPDYNLAMGKLTLDLRVIGDLETATPVTASVGMGELVVLVPDGAALDVNANVGAGQIEILGRVADGVGIEDAYSTPGFDDSLASLSLELQTFTGRVEVTDE
jgi:hypothetical protein